MNNFLHERTSEEFAADCGKISAISRFVKNMGYDFDSDFELTQIIKKNNIDLSGFSLPYSSKSIDEWADKEMKIINSVNLDEEYKEIPSDYDDIIL